MNIKAKQSLSSFLFLSVFSLLNFGTVNATLFKYDNLDPSRSIMNDYSVSWDTVSESLSIKSSWDASANLDSITFLLSDGASPWVTGNNSSGEQFLWHEIDLITGILSVKNYFGSRQVLETFNVSAFITLNSIDLSLDHSYLNSLSVGDINTVTGRNHTSYNGAGFSSDIGIWYYMRSNGRTVETLDVHHGQTYVVPEPSVLFLFAIGMLALNRRSLLKRLF